MINTQIRQLREAIITTTNASGLPIEVKRLVFVEVLQQLQEKADEIIRSECTQIDEEEECE